MNEKTLEIVIGAKEGKEDAFLKLHERYYKQAYYYALKLCQYNEADAFDVVQETFLSIHENIKHLQKPEYFSAWLSKIVFTKATKLFSKNKDVILEQEQLKGLPNQYETHRAFLPKENLNECTDQEIVQSLIHELSPKLQEALILIYFKQMSFQECADYLKVPVGTLKSRVNQARNQLKEKVIAFEEREQRRIDFKLETLLGGTASFALLAHMKVWWSTALPQGVNLVVVAMVSAVTLVGSVALYDHYTNKRQAEPYTFSNQDFQPVRMEGKEINSPKTAYYYLMNWAGNESEMKDKSVEEIKHVRHIVSSLKETNSTYKQMLEDKGWFQLYESL